MPSHYAHYRFGDAAIALLPAQARNTVRRFRQLYDVGLQGPDIFFYHNIFFRDRGVSLGKRTHSLSGEEFFGPICKMLLTQPSDGARAYFYGLLAHYCLDSTLHPFVLEKTESGQIGHVELETEFDRYLLQLDGNRQPNTYDLSPHIRLTQGECVTAALFYPGAKPGMVRQGVRGMAASVRFLAMPNGNLRRIAQSLSGAGLGQYFMGRSPNRRCAGLNGEMLGLYEFALTVLPRMLQQVHSHLETGSPLGPLFEPTFDG